VRSNEVTGTIIARDLGDPRITDHFYAFTGVPGDLMITVESRNLNGDVDVFTLSGLRPLMKFTLYAGNSSPIAKTIYLRKQEDLILRVEGRTPNDDAASYHIRFGGAFEPITSGALVEHEDALQPSIADTGSARGGKRVSSVGARIEEPRTEVAEAPSPQPTPAETSERTVTPVKPTLGNRRARRPAPRRTRPAPATKPETTVRKSETETTAPTEMSEPEAKPPAKAKRSSKRSTASSRAAKPVETLEPDTTGPRLIIETNDGTLVDRFMNSVRRVTIENGQVVVVGKDGKIQRIPLATVVRMTISP
jgi:hypothetical protein